MSDVATKEDLKKIDLKMDRLEFLLTDFVQKTAERFDKLEKSIDKLTNTIDGFVKHLEDIKVDDAARDAQLARHERWFDEIAKKTGIKLVH